MKRTRREYQSAALKAVRQRRQIVLYWARRCRKSTTLGDIAFDVMAAAPGSNVIAASASLLLGSELVSVTLSSAEQGLIAANEARAMRDALSNGAEGRELDLRVANAETGRELQGLGEEDFAELYKSSKMELRLMFDRTAYSRPRIIAPNPATARGWRGTVLRDECGYTRPELETELRVATDPIMRDTPDMKMVYASNLCPSDRHPYFEDTMPREITAESEEEQFPPNAQGHFYVGLHGLLVHRVALQDAYAAGHLLYDDQGAPMTYAQCRAYPAFKMGWDISYALGHKPGGAAVIDLVQLLNAQRRGARGCSFVFVESDADFRRALALLRAHLGAGPVGIGCDPASTTGETSNPTSVAVTEAVAGERWQRINVCWKERREAVQRERLRAIVECVRSRPFGGPARKLCINADNERLFAEGTAAEFAGLIVVEAVVHGAAVTPPPPGYHSSVNYKTYLGDLYATAINDGRYALPSDDYVKADHRMVLKDNGRYLCTPDADGRHGDTFDSGKEAEWALHSPEAGPIYVFEGSRRSLVIADRRHREVNA